MIKDHGPLNAYWYLVTVIMLASCTHTQTSKPEQNLTAKPQHTSKQSSESAQQPEDFDIINDAASQINAPELEDIKKRVQAEEASADTMDEVDALEIELREKKAKQPDEKKQDYKEQLQNELQESKASLIELQKMEEEMKKARQELEKDKEDYELDPVLDLHHH